MSFGNELSDIRLCMAPYQSAECIPQNRNLMLKHFFSHCGTDAFIGIELMALNPLKNKKIATNKNNGDT
jgi:hypothetical protein